MSAQRSFFVSVMSTDRPGIIAHLGERLAALGGNIEDLSQTVMRGHFTILLFVRVPAEVGPSRIEAAVTEGLADLAVGVSESDGLAPPEPLGQRLILTLRGPDRPGLIGLLGSFLAGRDLNIEDMYARAEPDDEGAVLMVLQLRCPPRRDLRQLQLDVGELADEHGLIAHLQHENVFRATCEIGAVRGLTL